MLAGLQLHADNSTGRSAAPDPARPAESTELEVARLERLLSDARMVSSLPDGGARLRLRLQELRTRTGPPAEATGSSACTSSAVDKDTSRGRDPRPCPSPPDRADGRHDAQQAHSPGLKDHIAGMSSTAPGMDTPGSRASGVKAAPPAPAGVSNPRGVGNPSPNQADGSCKVRAAPGTGQQTGARGITVALHAAKKELYRAAIKLRDADPDDLVAQKKVRGFLGDGRCRVWHGSRG